MQKAYKLLSIQEGISNNTAKKMIDKGLVSVGGRILTLARRELKEDTTFKIVQMEREKILDENKDIVCIDKPAFMDSYELARKYPKLILLNRLDTPTSGIILFAKSEEFRSKAIKEFKNLRVYKEYGAIVSGRISEEMQINMPIFTNKKQAKSIIDAKKGKQANTIVYPFMIDKNHSFVKVVIKQGLTHQIRLHLSYKGFAIIGDRLYGKNNDKTSRLMLHSHKYKILDYSFTSPYPKQMLNFLNN